jgi:hypothetical protein
MMKKYLLYLILLMTVFVVFGCGSKKESNSPMPEPNIRVMRKTDNLAMDIYLDGTYSMAGYVNYPSTTVYTNAIKEIERTVSSAWRNEDIQYIRFGDGFKKLSREQFLGFDKISFYDQKDTSLQKVVDSMDGNKINVIVTDLFQTDQDIESLMASLKKKSFADFDKALAIIGLKSQFKGKIYDIGKNKLSFDYETNDKDSYRPFYLLIVGNEDDVRSFVLQYQKNLKDEKKAVLFAKNFGTNNVLVQGANSKTSGDNTIREAIMAKVNTVVKSNKVMQFRLKLDEKVSKANMIMQTDLLIGNFPDKYKLVIESLQKWKDNSFQNIEAKDFLKADIKEFDKENEKANLTMTLRVNPLGINKREGQYKAELALIPSKEDYLKSVAIFDDWNFYDSDVTLGNIKGFGNKTLNISVFTKMMGSLNYEINKPGFYNLPIYLDAKK